MALTKTLHRQYTFNQISLNPTHNNWWIRHLQWIARLHFRKFWKKLIDVISERPFTFIKHTVELWRFQNSPACIYGQQIQQANRGDIRKPSWHGSFSSVTLFEKSSRRVGVQIPAPCCVWFVQEATSHRHTDIPANIRIKVTLASRGFAWIKNSSLPLRVFHNLAK